MWRSERRVTRESFIRARIVPNTRPTTKAAGVRDGVAESQRACSMTVLRIMSERKKADVTVSLFDEQGGEQHEKSEGRVLRDPYSLGELARESFLRAGSAAGGHASSFVLRLVGLAWGRLPCEVGGP